MKNIIVTTTINPITAALRRYCAQKDWSIIIVGDKKTPHEMYRKLEKRNQRVLYLSPDDQMKKYPKLSATIGWNCIQRRSLGYIEAYALGAQIIATVDDDNIPYDTWGKNICVGKRVGIDYFETNLSVFDPLSVTNHKSLWHRGFPLELLSKKNEVKKRGRSERFVHVQADLWDGDPDIDAICRYAYRPDIKFSVKRPYGSNAVSPFNSQNTFISREALTRFYLMPGVGRMDDIWGAYILQVFFPKSVVYNKASVFQKRNIQSTLKNLKDELLGYEYSLQFVQSKGAYEKFLPEQSREFIRLYDAQIGST